jgi:UDP-N-acetyl-D-glucosamine dehydrogenase
VRRSPYCSTSLVSVSCVARRASWRIARPDTVELESADAVVLLADHDAFDLNAVQRHGRYVLDTRRRLSGEHVEHL